MTTKGSLTVKKLNENIIKIIYDFVINIIYTYVLDNSETAINSKWFFLLPTTLTNFISLAMNQ